MLVLSRKPNESIRIANDVVLTVLQVQGNRVRLGIEAPAKVKIRRSELPPRAESDHAISPIIPNERAIA